jgi:peptidoglycan-associated lipoprotein
MWAIAEDRRQMIERVIRAEQDAELGQATEIVRKRAELIAAEARRLTGNRTLSVRLEGHTDERGSREYNIALGERRAQAVRRALLLLGVSESQVQTVSLGEERLAAEGGTEDAHSRNRRVEITDRP